jgi:hypothetical protein
VPSIGLGFPQTFLGQKRIDFNHAVPSLKEKSNVMLHEKSFFEQTWSEIEMQIERSAKQAKKEFKLYKHSFGRGGMCLLC